MVRHIRIIYVIDFLDTNLAGTENQLIKLINGLDKKKFEVQLLCFRNHPWLEANANSLDCVKTIIDISQFGRFSTYRNIYRLIKFFWRAQPDIVHTFFPVANIIAVVAARMAGVRNIISSRRDYGEWMSAGYLRFTKLANRFVCGIIANSPSVKALTIDAEKIAGDKVEVLYNGIDAEPFKDLGVDWDLKQRLGIPRMNKVVGIIANFRPMKRHDTFVRAAHEILKARTDVDFVLVGGIARLQEQTEALGHTLGIAEKLHFVGPQHSVIPYLSIMHVGVNCSEREGFSNAVMEYMAAGVPCVVAASGGNSDIITNGVDGLTFPLGDHRALAENILKLLNDEALGKEFARKGRQKIDSELTVTAMLSAHQRFYQNVIARTMS